MGIGLRDSDRGEADGTRVVHDHGPADPATATHESTLRRLRS
jgi:hypothetical protein